MLLVLARATRQRLAVYVEYRYLKLTSSDLVSLPFIKCHAIEVYYSTYSIWIRFYYTQEFLYVQISNTYESKNIVYKHACCRMSG